MRRSRCFCAAYPRLLRAPAAAEPAWLRSWRAADAARQRRSSATLGDEPHEPNVARVLARESSPGNLFVAASMAIRHLESFWPPRRRRSARPFQPRRHWHRRHARDRARDRRGAARARRRARRRRGVRARPRRAAGNPSPGDRAHDRARRQRRRRDLRPPPDRTRGRTSTSGTWRRQPVSTSRPRRPSTGCATSRRTRSRSCAARCAPPPAATLIRVPATALRRSHCMAARSTPSPPSPAKRPPRWLIPRSPRRLAASRGAPTPQAPAAARRA